MTDIREIPDDWTCVCGGSCFSLDDIFICGWCRFKYSYEKLKQLNTEESESEAKTDEFKDPLPDHLYENLSVKLSPRNDESLLGNQIIKKLTRADRKKARKRTSVRGIS